VVMLQQQFLKNTKPDYSYSYKEYTMKWNTDLYDNKHDFVSKYGEDLIELLNPQKGELIADLGSGTGDLANIIVQKGAQVIGFDHSEEMVTAAKMKYPHIPFYKQSVTAFNYNFPFDAVFSNATLHWVLEKEKAVQCIYRALKPGGRLVVEFGGKGNVANIINALQQQLRQNGYSSVADKQVWYFPSLGEYSGLLEKNGFRVMYATLFNRETLLKGEQGIVNWLLQFGQPYLKDIPETDKHIVLEKTIQMLQQTNFKNGKWFAHYVRLRVVAYKL